MCTVCWVSEVWTLITTVLSTETLGVFLIVGLLVCLFLTSTSPTGKDNKFGGEKVTVGLSYPCSVQSSAQTVNMIFMRTEGRGDDQQHPWIKHYYLLFSWKTTLGKYFACFFRWRSVKWFFKGRFCCIWSPDGCKPVKNRVRRSCRAAHMWRPDKPFNNNNNRYHFNFALMRRVWLSAATYHRRRWKAGWLQVRWMVPCESEGSSPARSLN